MRVIMPICVAVFSCIGVDLGATLIWSEKHLSLKAVPGQESVSASFVFRVEEVPVTILDVRADCGCTATQVEKRQYAPGETGEIGIVFDLRGRRGTQRKSVWVTTDEDKDQRVELVVEVDIPEILKLEPRFLFWDKNATAWEPQSIIAKVDVPEKVEITEVKTDSELLRVEWVALDDESGWELIMTPDIPAGGLPFFRVVIDVRVRMEEGERSFMAYAFMKEY